MWKKRRRKRQKKIRARKTKLHQPGNLIHHCRQLLVAGEVEREKEEKTEVGLLS